MAGGLRKAGASWEMYRTIIDLYDTYMPHRLLDVSSILLLHTSITVHHGKYPIVET